MDIEKLRKEINGKLVTWGNKSELGDACFNAILLWPPNGESISLKPYGYDPEEVFLLLHTHDTKPNGRQGNWTLKNISSPMYCFAVMPTGYSNIDVIKRVAKIKEGGHIDMDEIAGRVRIVYGQALCPYGG